MLEMYREFSACGNQPEISALTEKIRSGHAEKWTRDLVAENAAVDERSGGSFSYTVFKWAGPQPKISRAFFFHLPETIKLTNIVPHEFGRLTMQEYNFLFDSLMSNFIRPYQDQFPSLHFEITSAFRDISEWLNAESYKLLLAFSHSANRGTGSSHPNDKQRWLEFIISVHRNRPPLNSEILERWLVEEENWSQSIASDLSTEYYQGLELLRQYDARE